MESPIPSNEYERLLELAELDLDYTNLQDDLEDLTKLAAGIVGAQVSLVNLIDSYTQWSVANFGLDQQQIPREESVCQYTIMDQDSLEIIDLHDDNRFNPKSSASKGPNLRYYYGIPLTTSGGVNIGALCVLDPQSKEIPPEKKELLKMIANQVVRRLEAMNKIKKLEDKIGELNETNRKVSHDIRSPVSGIIGIAQIMEEEIQNERIKEVLELVDMIKKGGQSLLELANSIMEQEDAKRDEAGQNEISCAKFCEKLRELYQPQARSKKVTLDIHTLEESDRIFFSKSRLLQIVGNLITNSIKFTPEGGEVTVQVKVNEIGEKSKRNELTLIVEDTGVGMSGEKVEEIISGQAHSADGTGGEKGYGFGLNLVRHLIGKADGTMEISSEKGKGTQILITLPV